MIQAKTPWGHTVDPWGQMLRFMLGCTRRMEAGVVLVQLGFSGGPSQEAEVRNLGEESSLKPPHGDRMGWV